MVKKYEITEDLICDIISCSVRYNDTLEKLKKEKLNFMHRKIILSESNLVQKVLKDLEKIIDNGEDSKK